MCVCVCVHMCAKSLQSCWTLCDTMDCSPPGSSIHGILQARILQWVAVPSYRGSSLLREGTCILDVGSLPPVPPGKPIHVCVCVCVCRIPQPVNGRDESLKQPILESPYSCTGISQNEVCNTRSLEAVCRNISNKLEKNYKL